MALTEAAFFRYNGDPARFAEGVRSRSPATQVRIPREGSGARSSGVEPNRIRFAGTRADVTIDLRGGNMHDQVVDLRRLDETQRALAGGKGANLGALQRIEGIRVPAGFCVTTAAFRRVVTEAPSIAGRIARLSAVRPDDGEAIRGLCAELREAIEGLVLPGDLADAIESALAAHGAAAAYAVRSSATAEDLPTASFAGQQDTFLNVAGTASILRHVVRCWASLFTERAATYRIQQGIDHRAVRMAVVVQRMIAPQASGVLFTADPLTGNRKVAAVEAIPGLGEALVSGRARADGWRVRAGAIVDRSVGTKDDAADGSPPRQALTDEQVLELVELGRRIEARFGRPQDIEWCLADGAFHFVQSRPITTLFPVPDAGDGANHVYVSVGHQQMMTDAIKPLGISFFQLTAGRPMFEAGGRLFVDVTQALATPAGRRGLVAGLGRSDPLIGDALQTLVDRGDFVPALPDAPAAAPAPAPPALESDPAIVRQLVESSEASLAELRREIRGRAGVELLDFIRADLEELKREMFDPRRLQAIWASVGAAAWLNEKLETWLGEKNAADVLAQSVPGNVTSEMGLALLDVADAIRPHPAVVEFLRTVDRDDFLDALASLPGGAEARDAIRAWLDRYGMRCAGEIDITRPRWSERPAALLPTILGHVASFAPGEAARRFEQGRREAAEKERTLLERLRGLPDGEAKAAEAKRQIDRLRTFAGFREYPKYAMVSRYFVYKQALLEEADRLVAAGVLREREQIFFLSLPELREVVRAGRADLDLVRRREEAFREHQALHPPRVLTSDGEAIRGAYRRGDVPAGALVGLAVSAGVVEGRARVARDMASARIEPGDILVTCWTDPSWTPLFVSIRGLVTEVGGLMTRRGDRPRVRPARRGRRGERHPPHPRRPADPPRRHQRLRRVAERVAHGPWDGVRRGGVSGSRASRRRKSATRASSSVVTGTVIESRMMISHGWSTSRCSIAESYRMPASVTHQLPKV